MQVEISEWNSSWLRLDLWHVALRCRFSVRIVPRLGLFHLFAEYLVSSVVNSSRDAFPSVTEGKNSKCASPVILFFPSVQCHMLLVESHCLYFGRSANKWKKAMKSLKSFVLEKGNKSTFGLPGACPWIWAFVVLFNTITTDWNVCRHLKSHQN